MATPDQPTDDANYQPPPEKTIDDLVKADADDPALQRYKEALLGSAVAGSGAVIAELWHLRPLFRGMIAPEGGGPPVRPTERHRFA